MRLVSQSALLPIILTGCLMVSACQDASSFSEDGRVETKKPTDNASATSLTDSRLASNQDDSANKTDEAAMTDNLIRYRWILTNATDQSGQSIPSLMSVKDQVTLIFNQRQGQNSLSYSVGCNTITAAYSLNNQHLTAEEAMGTKMSCGELDEAENQLTELMLGNSQLRLTEADTVTLTQVTSDAATLVWSGSLTPQAKYNSVGRTIFWAVSSETKPCTDNEDEGCLQVKPITYDAQGIKVSEGEWTLFNGTIDGYQHNSDFEDILRLQRYRVVDADNSESADSYAYVLDMIIERASAK